LWAATLNPLIELVCAFIVAPLVVRASLSFGRSNWAMSLGALSYPLYATHVPAIGLAKLLGAHALTSFAFSALVAIAVTLLFEARRKPAKRANDNAGLIPDAVETQCSRA
jgi:peptidoglycan/LPS O-acetylase OafA/YrhL